MKLIGINGFKESGKDTTYKLIARDCARPGPAGRVERRAFADKLKIMAALALGFEREEDELIALMDSMKAKSAFTILYDEPGTVVTPGYEGGDTAILHQLNGREYLQWFGGHARSVFGLNFWVDLVVPEDPYLFTSIWSTVGRNTEGVQEVEMPAIGCVTDCRYPNEAERVLGLGGDVLEIVRPGLISDGHSSEQVLPRSLVTQTITNDGSIEDLAEQLRDYLEGDF